MWATSLILKAVLSAAHHATLAEHKDNVRIDEKIKGLRGDARGIECVLVFVPCTNGFTFSSRWSIVHTVTLDVKPQFTLSVLQ